MKYKVKNWDEYQHYKDRNPPWIKMHFALLTSEDWVMLDDASRVLAVACLLIASRHDGFIPHKPAYIKRVAYLNSEPDFKPLIECGFLEPDSECEQMLADARPEERQRQRRDRGETEGGGAKTAPSPPPKNSVSRPDDIDEQTWSDFLAHRRQKKAKLTPTAWKAIRKQLDAGIQKGYDPNEMLAVAMAAGWQGFELEWYENRKRGNQSKATTSDDAAEAAIAYRRSQGQ